MNTIIRSDGGQIRVESKENQRTIFTITLPCDILATDSYGNKQAFDTQPAFWHNQAKKIKVLSFGVKGGMII